MHDFSASWGLAVISIVLVSWIVFRYLAPRGRREWTRAGIFQAFIIAFYAEMYGFPVTLYALTRLFGLDVQSQVWRGNLWAYLSGSEATMLVTMIAGYTISIFGILLLIRGWRGLYRGAREHRLVTDIAAEHGSPYEEYRQRVPMFIPRAGAWRALLRHRQTSNPAA